MTAGAAEFSRAAIPEPEGLSVVLPDDGSTDGSWKVLRAIAAGDSSVRLV